MVGSWACKNFTGVGWQGVPGSNLDKVVETKPVIIFKFKLKKIILSNLKEYELVVL